MKHHKEERSLVIIKPDGIQRSLTGEVIKRYERIGLKLVGIKMLVASKDLIESHYTVDPEWKMKTGQKAINSYLSKDLKPPSEDPLEVGNYILKRLTRYMTSGPIIAMVWKGAHSVAIVRKITGATEPLTSDVGTIRGDLMLDSYQMSDIDERSVRNIIHASGTPEEAEREIAFWFDEKEIINYRLIAEQILYDVNLDGILE